MHISNNHCGYKALCNQIILNKYYWEGYTNYVKEYLNECELCNGNKKNNKIIPPVKIILDEGPKYRYIFEIYNIPETLCENTPYIYLGLFGSFQ